MAIIGFIGLGNMGGPMAANLVKAGHTVTGYDLSPAALDTLAKAGGKTAASAADAAAGASVVITMLPAGEHVRDVWLHQGGLIEAVRDAKPLLIDCSTIDVDSARAVTAAAGEAGLAMLDAPVSGGTVGAANGTLTFMVGGSEAAFAAGKPILEAMGRNIFHAGGELIRYVTLEKAFEESRQQSAAFLGKEAVLLGADVVAVLEDLQG